MPRVGTFNYPGTSLDEAITMAKKFVQRFGSASANTGAVIALFRLNNVRPGRIMRMISDLVAFGLLAENGRIAATPLALRLTDPQDKQEYITAVLEAAFSVPLYSSINEVLPRKAPPNLQSLTLALNILTGAPLAEARRYASRIQSSLLDTLVREVPIERPSSQ